MQNVELQELKDYCGFNYIIDYCKDKGIAYTSYRWRQIEPLLEAAIENASASKDI